MLTTLSEKVDPKHSALILVDLQTIFAPKAARWIQRAGT